MGSDLMGDTSMKLTVDIPNELSFEEASCTASANVDNKESCKFRVHKVRSFGDLIFNRNSHAVCSSKDFKRFLSGLDKSPDIPDELSSRNKKEDQVEQNTSHSKEKLNDASNRIKEEEKKITSQKNRNAFHQTLDNPSSNVEEVKSEVQNEENIETEPVNALEFIRPAFHTRKKSLDSKAESAACVLCFDSFPDAVLMECGHSAICFRCGLKLLKLKGKCPLCREGVTLILRVDVMNRHGRFVRVIDSVTLQQAASLMV
eukprot:TRINITY_DN11054_c0_g4_i1.p1 TRINITY_DN11054_c0_g4~~TRINITY_DN11054_c0_g4_i1.p1  ORF type:complete len:259 (-),score=67.61 TRINITY_DN11054_c0_g4_i1:66-842(-)